MEHNSRKLKRQLNETNDLEELVELKITDESEVYTLMVSEETKRRAYYDLYYAKKLLEEHKNMNSATLQECASTSTCCLAEHSASTSMKESCSLMNLGLFDESTNEIFKICVDEYTYKLAKNDLNFATNLLNKHKNTITAPEVTADGKAECRSKGLMDNENDCYDDNDENEFNEQSTVRSGRHLWGNGETKLLINLYKENDDDFSAGLLTHRKFWRTIHDGQKIKGHNLGINQCITKMDSLKRRYNEVKDHNSRSGNDRKSCPYYEELDEIFNKKPWVKPLSTAGSNLPLSSLDNPICSKRSKRMSLQAQKADFLEKCLEEKRLKREATEAYRSRKLSIMEDLVKTIQK